MLSLVEVMHAPEGMVVDHKDRHTLDNRPCNLRVCTPAQNEYNKAPRGKRSKYKGVYPDGDKWYALLKHQGVTYYLGTFDDEVAAATHHFGAAAILRIVVTHSRAVVQFAGLQSR